MSAIFIFLLFFTSEPCIRDLAFEPASVRVMQPMHRYDFIIRIRVEPHDDHRVLDLTWEGDDRGSGHSTRQLEGAMADITHRLAFTGVPGGRWVFTARIIGANGKVLGAAAISTLYVSTLYRDAKNGEPYAQAAGF
jgi:hypothetical protein